MGVRALARGGVLIDRWFDDADRFARCLAAAELDYVPLPGGPYRARLVALDLGAVLLQCASDEAHIARGVASERRVTVLMPLQIEAGPLVNGFALGRYDAIVLGPGAELRSYCPGRQDWAAISFEAAAFARLSGCKAGDTRDGPGDRRVRLDPRRAWATQYFIKEIRDLCTSQPAVVDSPHIRRSIESELTGRLASALVLGERAGPAERVVGAEVLRLLRRCEEFIDSRMGQPIYTQELCELVGVSPRKLHNAFMAVCGMSPHAYLKLRRLVLVRRALKASAPEEPLVKSVALAHGFWHLGHFARDYRAQFGETPSQTLAGANTAPHGAASARIVARPLREAAEARRR